MTLQSFKDRLRNIHQRRNSIEFDSPFKYLIGRNDESSFLAGKYAFNGVIDDFDSSPYCGLAAVKMEEVDRNALILNCVSSIWPVSVGKKLRELGFNNVHDISGIYCNDMFSGHGFFIDEARVSIENNIDLWGDLYESMCDENSKKILESILMFRLTGDTSFMNSFTNKEESQYFEDFIPKKTNFTFIDAGSYDGYTSKCFISYFGLYDSVMIFEPSPNNFDATQKALRHFSNIEFYNVGLGAACGELFFSEDGSSSRIGMSGNLKIAVKKLDDYADLEKSFFVKMDLEGFELEALQGAKNIILKGKSVFAIAVYHSINDFIEVSKFINSFGVKYRTYLRHYTEGWSETIMFFIPEELY